MTKPWVVSLLSVSLLLSAPQVFSAENAKQQKQLSSLTNQIQLLQKALLHNQTTAQTLQQQLKTNAAEITNLKQQTTAVAQQLLAKEDDIEKIKQQQRATLADLNQQQKTLTQHLRLMYQLGQTPSVKAFLSPENIHTTNRHVTYYHYINEARLKLMTNIKQTLADLDTSMATYAQEEQSLRTLLAQKQEQQQKLMFAQQKRLDLVAQLSKLNNNKQHQLAGLTNNEKNLRNTLASLAADPALNVPNLPFKDLQGKLPWPIKTADLPTETSKDTSGHFFGTVIKTPEGTPVRAIYGGKVIYAKNMPGYGLLVIVNHGNGFMSLYARNHAIYAHSGDVVKPGTVLASSGKSGGFSDPSLYFEIRRNGASVDPHNWCV